MPKVLVSDPIDQAGIDILSQVAQVDVRTGLPAAELAQIIGDYDALMIRSGTQVTAEIIAAADKLRIIGRAGVGVDNVDVPAATKRGVLVVNSPEGNTIAAAEHALALMLSLSRQTVNQVLQQLAAQGAVRPTLGGTEIVFEGVPTYPDAGRFWKMIQDHKVSIFYTAPTAIRSLIKAAEANAAVHPKSYDLSSLRILGSVGEPINPAAWEWYHANVGGGRCPIVDTFWQTETGGHMITPMPGATPLVAGSCTLPFPGIQTAIVDELGADVPNGQAGILVVKKPWPSMIRTIWGDNERFKKSYYPVELKGYYLAGDGAIRDKDTGYFTITGRIDDVLNVSGHRMGTMEIESALVSCTELVAEAAVVGRPDDTTGEAICAFVVLKRSRPTGDEAKKIAADLRNWVAKEIGPIAKPKDIRFGDNLPKTRSGKIMRRLLRSIAKGEAITQDTSTLENPAILEQLTQTN
jgi:acetyl-CoA synthetase